MLKKVSDYCCQIQQWIQKLSLLTVLTKVAYYNSAYKSCHLQKFRHIFSMGIVDMNWMIICNSKQARAELSQAQPKLKLSSEANKLKQCQLEQGLLLLWLKGTSYIDWTFTFEVLVEVNIMLIGLGLQNGKIRLDGHNH